MLSSILNQPFSRAALVKACNEVLSIEKVTEPINDLAAIKGMLEGLPKARDSFYITALGTQDPKWIASIWHLCGIDDQSIAKNIVGLNGSKHIIESMIGRANTPNLADKLAKIWASRNDGLQPEIISSIVNQPYSRAALIKACNEVMSDTIGFEPTNDPMVIKGMLEHMPNARDILYINAGATQNPQWMASVWHLCGIDDEFIAKNIVRLDDSTHIIKSLIDRSNNPDLASDLVKILAERSDHLPMVKLLGEGVISREDFSKGLSSLSAPVVFGLKIRTFGVITSSDILSSIKENVNLGQLSLLLSSVEPSKQTLSWASKRFANDPLGGKHLRRIVTESPNLSSWAMSEIISNGFVKDAFDIFKSGQGLSAKPFDFETIKRFRSLIDLKTLEALVITNNDVDVAVRLVDMGLSDRSLSAKVMFETGVIDEYLSEYGLTASDTNALYEAMFDVELQPGETVGIKFDRDDNGERVASSYSKNQDQHTEDAPIIHSKLSPD